MAQNYELNYQITASDLAGNSVCNAAAITQVPMQLNTASEYYLNGLINFSVNNKFTVLRQISLTATKDCTINIQGYSNGVLVQEQIVLVADTKKTSVNYFNTITNIIADADIADGTLSITTVWDGGFIGYIANNASSTNGINDNSIIYNEFPLSPVAHPATPSTCTLYFANILPASLTFVQLFPYLAASDTVTSGEFAGYTDFMTTTSFIYCRFIIKNNLNNVPTSEKVSILQLG